MSALLLGALVAAALLMWPSRPAGTPAGWLARSLVAGPAGAGAASVRPGRRRRWGSRVRQALSWPGRRKRADSRGTEMLDLLDGIAPALRAGLPPVAALRAVEAASASGGEVTSALLAAASRGAALGPVWQAYARDMRSAGGSDDESDDVGLVAAAWSLCDSLGSPLAPTVTTVADLVRRRRAVRNRVEVAVAGPRATMRVLMALPLAGPVVALLLGLSPAQLYAGPAGLAALATGSLLLAGGWWWCRRLIAGVLRERRHAG